MSIFAPIAKGSVVIPPTERVYAFGDLHGHKHHMKFLLAKAKRDLEIYPLKPGQASRFVFLGDYVDRGRDSKGVVETAIGLQKSNPANVFLEGNHDRDFRDVIRFLSGDRRANEDQAMMTATSRGVTLQSYGIPKLETDDGVEKLRPLLQAVPDEHKMFFENLVPTARMGAYLFVHRPQDAFGDTERMDGKTRAAINRYIWDRGDKHSSELQIDGKPAARTIIVHGHAYANNAAPVERHAHRIGLDEFYDEGMLRIHCAVLETGVKPRYLSYTDKLSL